MNKDNKPQKQPDRQYVTPEIEIFDIVLEQNILGGSQVSDFTATPW